MNKYVNAVKGENAPDGFDESFTASTPVIDRHETVIPQANWKLANYNANAIIGYNHYVWGDEGWLTGKGDPDTVIGKGRAYINSVGNLQLDVKFDDTTSDSGARNETALKVKAKVDGGFLNSVSVGFYEKTEGRWLDKEGNEVERRQAEVYEYGEVELMEVSIVNLPANPEALVMSMKSEGDDLRKEIKSLEAFKKQIKGVGEEFTKVGETLQIFDKTDVSAKAEVEVEFVDEDFEQLELEKQEQINKQRKRKAQNRARRINL